MPTVSTVRPCLLQVDFKLPVHKELDASSTLMPASRIIQYAISPYCGQLNQCNLVFSKRLSQLRAEWLIEAFIHTSRSSPGRPEEFDARQTKALNIKQHKADNASSRKPSLHQLHSIIDRLVRRRCLTERFHKRPKSWKGLSRKSFYARAAVSCKVTSPTHIPGSN